MQAGLIPFHICDANATNEYVNNIELSIKPNPIQIKPGKTLHVDLGVDLLRTIPTGSRLLLKLKKDEIFDIPIPCLHVRSVPKY